MKITIRETTKSDVYVIYDLVRQLAEYVKESDAGINTVEDMVKNGFSKDKIFYSFVAETENKIIGMAVFYFAYSTRNGRYVYLDDLIVDEKISL